MRLRDLIEQPVYHAQTHVIPAVLNPRMPKNYNSIGTWFTSSPDMAKELYGKNVTTYALPEGNYLEAGDKLWVTLGHNLPLIEQFLGRDAADHLRRFPWNPQSDTPQMKKSREIVRSALLNQNYIQAFRSMLEGAGYDGIVWRNSQIDGASTPHDVYVIFNKDDIHPINEMRQPRPTDTPEFKAWFRDSKVVDAQGNPLVVYHGTDQEFTSFDRNRSIGGQYWFTSDRAAIERGEVGATSRGVILEVYLSIQNPVGWREYDQLLLDQIISRGHDGIILPDSGGANYIVFDPRQIKSIYNSGRWGNTRHMGR